MCPKINRYRAEAICHLSDPFFHPYDLFIERVASPLSGALRASELVAVSAQPANIFSALKGLDVAVSVAMAAHEGFAFVGAAIEIGIERVPAGPQHEAYSSCRIVAVAKPV